MASHVFTVCLRGTHLEPGMAVVASRKCPLISKWTLMVTLLSIPEAPWKPRHHSAKIKDRIVPTCRQLDSAVARVALAYEVNATLIYKCNRPVYQTSAVAIMSYIQSAKLNGRTLCVPQRTADPASAIGNLPCRTTRHHRCQASTRWTISNH